MALPIVLVCCVLILACMLPCIRVLLGGWWRAGAETYTLGTKVKLIVGFYQVASR